MLDMKDAIVEVIPQLRRYALSLTRDRHASDDLVQDALLRAMERQNQFTQGTNLRAWLFTIMHNLFVDQIRRKAPIATAVPLDESRSVPWIGAAQEPWIELKELARSVKALPLEQRTTLLLVCLEGLSYEETAAVTGVAVGTVKSRLSRAREALRVEATAPGIEPDNEPSSKHSRVGRSERILRRRASA